MLKENQTSVPLELTRLNLKCLIVSDGGAGQALTPLDNPCMETADAPQTQTFERQPRLPAERRLAVVQ